MFIGWVVGQHNVGTGEARISLRGILVLQGALSLLLALLFASIDGCHPSWSDAEAENRGTAPINNPDSPQRIK